ncbi:MAG: primosomal protein N' [Candidatus Omnitrophota bacterium]
MPYAKVVFGLPIEGPFDYIIPQGLRKKTAAGSRVIVSFGNRKLTGYIVAVTRQTNVRNLKSIIQAPDETPILNKNMLLTAEKLSEYYCCSWGEAIEAMLPAGLRAGKVIALTGHAHPRNNSQTTKPMLLHATELTQRWKQFYLQRIREALNAKKKVIILLPDNESIPAAEKIIRDNFKNPASALIRSHPEELKRWIEIKEGKVDIIIGTRSAVFAPVEDLGLIIVDEEHAYGYKQDQVPHYHAREAALLRAAIDKSAIILGSSSPSLESIYAAKKGKLGYLRLPRIKRYPEIKVIDTKRLPLFSPKKNAVFSRYLEDCIGQSLAAGEKVLLFLNRLGFATSATCVSCGATIKCPRCSINLVLHYKENLLICHYCNFKMAPPKLCPECNAGYLHYRGAGTEKIESELARIFPQAGATDIIVSSQSIIKEPGRNFGLIGVLSIDNTLNHPDFRSSEKAFRILNGLCALTDKKMVIQTGLPQNHIFASLANSDPDIFYDKEIKQRRELDFPPTRHFGLLKLRGKYPAAVELAAKALFDKLTEDKGKSAQGLSVNPGSPAKLRGNYYWQILIRARSAPEIGKFLKTHLHGLKHSGIIVTVDIDPV